MMAETEKDVIDTYGAWEFFAEMKNCLGVRRMTEITGWCILFGLTNAKSRIEARDILIKHGISIAAVYRATQDIEKFRAYLEEKRRQEVTVSDVFEDIRKFSAQGAYPMG
jgi:hypothetical protein